MAASRRRGTIGNVSGGGRRVISLRADARSACRETTAVVHRPNMPVMTNSIRTFGLVAAAGGAAWVTKFLVIAATDGAETGAADTATAILYMLAVLLMCIGASCITLRLARGHGKLATVAAFVAAPFLFILSYMLLDAIAKPLVGDAGPNWLDDEAGIVLTGAVWLVLGLSARSQRAGGR